MINKVILIGNVGADPEVRTLENGTKVARLRVATTERIFNRETQERRDHTEWHNVTLWRGLADVVDKYVRKGSQVYIEGKLRSREWEDPATQTKRYAIDIIADTMNMLGRKNEAFSEREGGAGGRVFSHLPETPPQQPAQPQPVQFQAPPVMPMDDGDDLPF